MLGRGGGSMVVPPSPGVTGAANALEAVPCGPYLGHAGWVGGAEAVAGAGPDLEFGYVGCHSDGSGGLRLRCYVRPRVGR